MPHGAGPQSEVNYRAAWARTHLRLIGAIDNTSRGVWAITEHGRSIDTEDKLRKLDKQPRVQRKSGRTPHLAEDNHHGTDDNTTEDPYMAGRSARCPKVHGTRHLRASLPKNSARIRVHKSGSKRTFRRRRDRRSWGICASTFFRFTYDSSARGTQDLWVHQKYVTSEVRW